MDQNLLCAGCNVQFVCNTHYQVEQIRRSNTSQKLLTKREVLERVPLSYGTIWLMMCNGTFPRPRVTSPFKNGRVLWLEADIDEWIGGLPEQVYKRPRNS
jgi:predicted DNA-binding transcriptional regulator AlpA